MKTIILLLFLPILLFGQCPTISNPNQSFCDSQSPTVGTLIVTNNGGGVAWYANAAGGVALSNTAILVNGEDYFVDSLGGGCSRQSVLVNIYDAPVGEHFQNVCVNTEEDATVSHLVANGNNIKWYTSAFGGSSLSGDTIITDNTIYYASQTNPTTGCETLRLSVTVHISIVPTPIANPVQSFCNDPLNIPQISNLQAGTGSHNWYTTEFSSVALNLSTPLINGATYYATTIDSPCESQGRFAVTVIINPLNTYFADVDSDGFGNPNSPIQACVATTGYVVDNTDCNDLNNAMHQTFPFYIDTDNDGFGAGSLTSVCAVNATTPPAGYSLNNLDCNDAQVRYQDLDNDGFGSTVKVACGGRTNSIDCNDNLLTYRDLDGDGYGINILVACGVPNNTDCNDNNPTIYQSNLFYVDADGDGYTSGVSMTLCYGAVLPSGFTLTNIGVDCNDNIAAINPGATEIAYNGIDDDCDGLIDEGFPLLQTTLLSENCNTTLASIGSLIGIQTISTHYVTAYRIKCVNGAQVQILESSVPHFTLPQFPSYDYATTYTISVELQRNGVWLGYYGPTCQISSPAILAEGGAAQIAASQCGITLSKINSLVATTSLPGVTGYRFRVSDVTNPTGPNAVQTIDRIQNWFSFPMLTRYNYGTTYRIEIAVKTGVGAFSGFGSPCEVSTPPTPTLTNCGGSVALGTTAVATASIAGVTQYRFQIMRASDGASTTIDRSTNYFIFNAVPPSAFSPGSLYYVRVAVMSAGTWSPFGDLCEITSPGSPAKGILTSTTAAVAKTDFKATAYPNPFDANFVIEMASGSAKNVQLKVYDLLGRLIESKELKATDVNTAQIGVKYPSGVYNVIISQGEIVKTLRVIKR